MASSLVTTGSSDVPEVVFQVRCEEEVPPPGESFQVDIVLRSAAHGMQRYELIFQSGDSVEDGAIVRIEKIESRTISAEHFQLVSKTDFSLGFKAIDVENVIQAGATDVVIATLTLRALTAGRTTQLELTVPEALIDDRGQEVEPQEILILPPADCESQ